LDKYPVPISSLPHPPLPVTWPLIERAGAGGLDQLHQRPSLVGVTLSVSRHGCCLPEDMRPDFIFIKSYPDPRSVVPRSSLCEFAIIHLVD
jgi:hypothetical protein